jgi:hypothetical protein
MGVSMIFRNPGIKLSCTIGLGIGLIYAAFIPPFVPDVDGNAMLEVAVSLVRNHNFRASPETGALGVDGYYYSKWYPLLSVLAVPFVAVGLAIGSALHLPEYYVAGACALTLSTLLTAASASFIVLLALRLGGDRQMACLAALSFAFGTIALTYAGSFFAEPLLGFLIIASLYFATGKTNSATVGASLIAGVAILAKPPAAILGPILSLYFICKKRSLSTICMPLLATGFFAIVYGIYNYVRFGDPLSFGQAWMSNIPNQIVSIKVAAPSSVELNLWHWLTLKLATPAQGIYGLLFSSGRGLLWYCPPVVLAGIALCRIPKNKRLEALNISAIFVGLLLIYSGPWWSGGWSWGPRYLLPTLPGLFVLIALLSKRWKYWLLALTLIGFLVNAPTKVMFHQRYYIEAIEQNVSSKEMLWSFDHAPFRKGWGIATRQINDALKSDVKKLVQSSGKPELRGEMTRVVSVWWWMLPVAGIPLGVGVGVTCLLIGAGILTIRAGILHF